MTPRLTILSIAIAFTFAQFLAYPQSGAGAEGVTLLEAVRSALANQTAIQLQKAQAEIARGAALIEEGAFDTFLDTRVTRSRTYTPLSALSRLLDNEAGFGNQSSQVLNSTNTSASVSRLFRNGVSVRVVNQLSRTADNLGSGGGLTASNLGIVVTFPLLQGRGRDIVDAAEIVARREAEATLLDVNQTIAQQLAQAATDYWNFVAALKTLDVTRASETRGRTLLDNTRTLVEADVVPQNDLNSVAANYADRTARRIMAQQGAVNAREQLAVDMGLGSRQVPLLQDPAEDFPAGENTPLPNVDARAIDLYLSESMQRRADVLATRMRQQEAEIRLRAARNLLEPRLDLSMTTGYSGLTEGRSFGNFLTSPFRGAQGGDVAGAIQFSYPVGNHAARGNVVQAQAVLRQANTRAEDVSRSAAADVLRSVYDLKNSIMGLQSTRQSVEAFDRALEGERQKFSLGLNSVIDVLTVEDRLTLALSNRVEAQRRYAVALIEFRLASGTIVDAKQAVNTVGRDVFVTFPAEFVNIRIP